MSIWKVLLGLLIGEKCGVKLFKALGRWWAKQSENSLGNIWGNLRIGWLRSRKVLLLGSRPSSIGLDKLKLVADHADGPAKETAMGMVKELQTVDLYSAKAAEMLGAVQKAAKGTPEQQMKAIKMLEVGLMAIKTGMHKHMEAMKALAHAPRSTATGRMQQLVAKLQAKIQAEIADPARPHDPMVGLDVMMLKALKTAVAKSEALEAAAKEVAKEHPEQAKAAAVALKQQLSKVAGDLKAEMADIKKKAMVMMIMMKEE